MILTSVEVGGTSNASLHWLLRALVHFCSVSMPNRSIVITECLTDIPDCLKTVISDCLTAIPDSWALRSVFFLGQ